MKYLLPLCFGLAAAICLALFFRPDWFSRSAEDAAPATKVVAPRVALEAGDTESDMGMERRAYEDANVPKIAIKDGEIAVSVLTLNMDNDPLEEQIIAYRFANDEKAAVNVAYIDFNDEKGLYERTWSERTAVTRPRTFSLYVKDLIGDRSVCVIAGGMNDSGEQTMVVFRKDLADDAATPLAKIAELHTDGSVVVAEKDRSQAYHLGLTTGESFKIATYGRDYESGNLLDQIETTYGYDPATGRYERASTARIPGIQIEQRRVRELLSGTPANFERFLDGLWSFSPTAGEELSPRFVHFDPERREVIFYADDTQEVYSWQNSNATRYGLYITTQNISVTTLRRLVDIELESIDTIRLKVFEDVKLKIGVGGLWDGSYRKLGSSKTVETAAPTTSRLDARYEGAAGILVFNSAGRYSLGTEPDIQTGLYAFFALQGRQFLELRTTDKNGTDHSTYAVERIRPGKADETLSLRLVKLGSSGIQELMETDLTFVKKPETAPSPNP